MGKREVERVCGNCDPCYRPKCECCGKFVAYGYERFTTDGVSLCSACYEALSGGRVRPTRARGKGVKP